MPEYDDFFTLIDGTRLDNLCISKYDRKYYILHPWFYFGTYCRHIEDYPYEDTYIYHKRFTFDINNDESKIIKKIVDLSIKYCYLENIGNLFYDTGYWCIEQGNYLKIGIGYDRFQNTIINHDIKYFTISITDPYFVFNISKNIEVNSQILVDIYAYNEILPFIEIVEPFQRACLEADGILNKEELILEHKIRNVWSSSTPIAINPVGFIMDKEYKMIPIINNLFKNTKYKDINKLRYLYGTRRGGFIDSEYNSDLTFLALIDIWEFQSIKLFNIIFEPSND